MLPHKLVAKLANKFVGRKVTVKTFKDESPSQTYEGIINGVAFDGKDITFFTNDISIRKVIVTIPYQTPRGLTKLEYNRGRGKGYVESIEVPLINGTTPMSEILEKYLAKLENNR